MTETTGAKSRSRRAGTGLTIERIFTTPGEHPYDQVTWEKRDVVQTNWKTGDVIFEQHGVEFPDFWSANASTIVTTKYFRGALGTEARETGLKQLIDRVVLTYTRAGMEHGYFATEQDAEVFEHELTYALVHQVFSFNSPVWFNVGTASPAQVSACFILSVDDSMDSILNWYKEEGFIFKGGSGAGLNLSRIRSSKELLSSGGTASGPVSFMRGADASAGTIKSGGATRRAAKMVVLDVDHPDIEEFVETKMAEEDKIRALRDAGFDMDLGGKDIVSVQYQNANNSVRVTDEFMRAVEDGGQFGLTSRKDGSVVETIDAQGLFDKMAQAAWACADPGMQYDDTINDWHTNPETGRITASNPCFVADTLVAVADGRSAVRIADLVGEDVQVYSKDSDGRTVTRRMSGIRRTRESAEIVRVNLDDASTVNCTPDHLFMLRDGSYIAAADLQPGHSLMRFDLRLSADVREAANDAMMPANHKVLSVVPVGQADVYDGEVEETHNFAIITSHSESSMSGVFVHNCSEYMSLDNSSCNLASLNLLKFLREDDTFDVETYEKVVELVITAMDISICFADFPTEAISETTRNYRQLGIGYANLGALLMATGRGYDSEGGRALAAALTSLLTGAAYKRSAELAGVVGPYAGYARNADAHKRVMRKHQAVNDELRPLHAMDEDIHKVATKAWDAVVKNGEKHGYRNAQASVLAPTGCLTGDTLITTDRGMQRLSDLGNVWGDKWQDLGVEVSTDNGARTATKFFINGEEPTRRVVTAGGYRIQGTLAHRIKVVDQNTGEWAWKRMAEVSSGDMVPLQLDTLVGDPLEVPLPVLDQAYYAGDREVCVPSHVDNELAELVGYFMGDGSLHAKGIRLCVADGDSDVTDRIGVLSKGLFNLAPTVRQQQGYQEVTLQSVRLARWWQAAGFAKNLPGVDHVGKGWTPRVPAAILETNNRVAYSAFLRGLFEADGTVLQGVPSFCTMSESFAGEVRTLMLALGYPTTTRQSQSGWGGLSHVVRVRNINHAQRFGTQIGFMGGRKASLVADHPSKQTGNRDRILLPSTVWQELVPVGHELRGLVKQAVARGNGVSRDLANKVHEATGDARVAHALEYIYEQVAVNEDGGVQPTYDLSVPSNVTYVAGGFVSHNTIGFMMDCDTTGIEPDFSLVKFKKLVGGGSMQIVNQTIPRALKNLGYTGETIEAIVEFIAEKGHVIDAPGLKPEHYEVFDCAMGARSIKPMGHVKMMAAAQPFLSGAISKTVNLPESATVEDIADVYLQGWKLGLKALAVYRDNCKVGQPLSDGKKDEKKSDESVDEPKVEKVVEYRPVRKRLPKRRTSQTTSFAVGGAEGYLTAGTYDSGDLGEIFLKFGKQGSTLAGVMDAFSIAVSVGLQYGVPLETFVEKFTNLRFEPAGMTDDPDVRMSQSLMDYVFRRLALDYMDFETRSFMGIHTAEERQRQLETGSYAPGESASAEEEDYEDELERYSQTAAPASKRHEEIVESPAVQSGAGAADVRKAEPTVHSSTELLEQLQGTAADAPMCMTCGTKMRPAGSCYVCEGCGSTSGCS